MSTTKRGGGSQKNIIKCFLASCFRDLFVLFVWNLMDQLKNFLNTMKQFMILVLIQVMEENLTYLRKGMKHFLYLIVLTIIKSWLLTNEAKYNLQSIERMNIASTWSFKGFFTIIWNPNESTKIISCVVIRFDSFHLWNYLWSYVQWIHILAHSKGQ